MRHVKLGMRNHGTRAGVACAGFFMPTTIKGVRGKGCGVRDWWCPVPHTP